MTMTLKLKWNSCCMLQFSAPQCRRCSRSDWRLILRPRWTITTTTLVTDIYATEKKKKLSLCLSLSPAAYCDPIRTWRATHLLLFLMNIAVFICIELLLCVHVSFFCGICYREYILPARKWWRRGESIERAWTHWSLSALGKNLRLTLTMCACAYSCGCEYNCEGEIRLFSTHYAGRFMTLYRTSMFDVHLVAVSFLLYDLLFYDGTHTRLTHQNIEKVRIVHRSMYRRSSVSEHARMCLCEWVSLSVYACISAAYTALCS